MDRAPVMDCELALSLAREAPALSALGVRTLLIGRVYHERRARLGGRSVNLRSRHALGLAVPLVVAVSTSLAASNGFLIRNRAPHTAW